MGAAREPSVPRIGPKPGCPAGPPPPVGKPDPPSDGQQSQGLGTGEHGPDGVGGDVGHDPQSDPSFTTIGELPAPVQPPG